MVSCDSIRSRRAWSIRCCGGVLIPSQKTAATAVTQVSERSVFLSILNYTVRLIPNMNQPHRFASVRLAFLLLCIGVLTPLGSPQAWAYSPPKHPTPTMPLDQIQQGMTGYGLTVFNGSKIEPFPVRIVSVVSNSAPRRSVIWIECDSKRLQRSGPVEGMSGSPIFLWPKGAKHVMGKNGLLIGAFAFGFNLSKGCLAGVQPIAYMRAIPSRIDDSPNAAASADSGSTMGLKLLNILHGMFADDADDPARPFLINPMRRLLNGGRLPKDVEKPTNDDSGILGPDGQVAGVHPLMLPMNVGSAAIAKLMAPLFKPFDINPVATGGGGLIAGKPPHRVNPKNVDIQPGASLLIPLAYGDLDLSAGGTVTDVLPDGTVLGFGHPMFGQGNVAVPLATGYVNFIVPRLTASFKMLGSLKIVGSVVRDESTGIAGIMKKRFSTAPVTVTVHYANDKKRVFHYTVVNHPGMTANLVAAVALQSITAIQDLPQENTLRLRGSLGFSGKRNLSFNALLPAASGQDTVGALVPILTTMMDNPHKRLKLTSVNITADVSPSIRMAILTNARMDKTEVAPGSSFKLTLQLQPYAKPAIYKTVNIHIPDDMPSGDYHLMVSGADQYSQIFVNEHPYLFQTQTVDDIYHTLKKLLAIKTTNIYCSLAMPHHGLAVGRAALPSLPSSRAALIAAPTNTYATAYKQSHLTTIKTNMAIGGALRFVVHVRKHPERADDNANADNNGSD